MKIGILQILITFSLLAGTTSHAASTACVFLTSEGKDNKLTDGAKTNLTDCIEAAAALSRKIKDKVWFEFKEYRVIGTAENAGEEHGVDYAGHIIPKSEDGTQKTYSSSDLEITIF
jgi:hypothetical protein